MLEAHEKARTSCSSRRRRRTRRTRSTSCRWPDSDAGSRRREIVHEHPSLGGGRGRSPASRYFPGASTARVEHPSEGPSGRPLRPVRAGHTTGAAAQSGSGVGKDAVLRSPHETEVGVARYAVTPNDLTEWPRELGMMTRTTGPGRAAIVNGRHSVRRGLLASLGAILAWPLPSAAGSAGA